MKEVNELWLQIASKSTISAIDHHDKPFNTNIAKVKAPNEFFGLLMILNQLIGHLQTNVQDFGICEDIHHQSILKLAIEKAIQKPMNANLSRKLFQDDSNDGKISLFGLRLCTKRAHC